MEIKEEEYAYPLEALNLLSEKEEEQLNHEQKIALENLKRHTKVRDLETLEKLHEEFEEIEALKDKHIFKILETVPNNESTVRALFSKERVKLEDSDIEDILEICESIEVEE